MFQTAAPELDELAVTNPTLRELYRQHRLGGSAQAYGFANIITYERLAGMGASSNSTQLSQSEIMAAAAYNLVTDAQASKGDNSSLLTA